MKKTKTFNIKIETDSKLDELKKLTGFNKGQLIDYLVKRAKINSLVK